MQRTLLGGKIHRATVTEACLSYEGSVTVDVDLLEAANILDVTNGARITTYAIAGERGSGVVRVNGAAAHVVLAGDTVIIANFVVLTDAEARTWSPSVVFVDSANRIAARRHEEPGRRAR